MESEFTKCPEGHIYESKLEECPFCNGEEEIEDKLSEAAKKIVKKVDLSNLAMCYLRGPKI
ncbi:MAG: hypothetical protein FWB86_09200 [Treponema sp.]|nr:hypothetical protein [Treponema sp.]MCL2251254.1 hypothetical protein [Treponema sp.]